MNLAKKQLLRVGITVDPKHAVLDAIHTYLHTSPETSVAPCVVVTPNPEQLVEASVNAAFRSCLSHADIALPDGVGVVFALWMRYRLKISRLSGIDFLSELVRMANKDHATIACIGGRNDTAHKALIALQTTYIELHGWSEQPKEFADAADVAAYPMESLVRKIIETNTKIVFVGLGAPKQEFFIDAIAKRLKKFHAGPVVLMAVGGSFDMLAGTTPRAPSILQSIGLEWLYRLVREPWRWKRQLRLWSFLFLVFREQFSHT